ncbi:MAG: ferritin-like domain-containing protein [Chloroflexota bacterium]|nr:ferritin-like domain-containing protein [Chloroflexota bacterium]
MASPFASFLAAARATNTARVPFFANDLQVLNYALTLEHLENEFYKQVNASGRLQGNAAAYLRIIGQHEQTHVDTLTSAIQQAGGTPVRARRSYNFAALGDLSSQQGILTVALALEATGVGAYNGAGREIQSDAILAAAGSIVAVEARHTAAVKALLDPNGDPVDPAGNPPDAFEQVLDPQTVLNTVTPILGPEA